MGPDAKQRWRLYLRVPAPTTGRAPGGARGWARLFAAAGLPLAGEESGRGRVAPAAPLPLGVEGDREVVDVNLTERLPVRTVRELMAAALPPDIALVDLHDVWVGSAAAPAAVVAAEYEVAASGPDEATARDAVSRVVGAAALPRARQREGESRPYDLRPLIQRLEIVGWDDRAADGPGGRFRMRLAHEPGAVGRPEEVVAAVGEMAATAASRGGSDGRADAVGASSITIQAIRRLAVILEGD